MTKRTRLIEQLIEKYQLKPVSPDSDSYLWLHGVRELAKAQQNPLAVCDLAQSSYHFLEMPHPSFQHLLKAPISTRRFRLVIYEFDRDHFDNAQQLALDFIAHHQPCDVGRYLLTFECRLTDINSKIHNMQLKYWLMGTQATGQQPALTLHLMAIKRVKGSICPPRTGYIVDTLTHTIVQSFGCPKLTDKDVDLFKEIRKANSLKNAASNIPMNYKTLRARRLTVFEKLDVKSDSEHAAIAGFMCLN